MQFLHKRLLNLPYVVSSGGISLPAMAQSPEGHLPDPQQITSSPQTVIQSTSIIVNFPTVVVIDTKQDESYPIPSPLAQAIRDDQGEVVIPKNTPVNIMLAPRGAVCR